MGCINLTKYKECWNRRYKFPGPELDVGYTGNRYLPCVRLPGQLKKMGA